MKPEYLYAVLGVIILINMILVFKFAGKKSGGVGATTSNDVHETYEDISREDKTELVFEDEEEETPKSKEKPQEIIKEKEEETVKKKPAEKVKAKEVEQPVIQLELEIPELSDEDKTEIEIEEEEQDVTMVEEEEVEEVEEQEQEVPVIAALSYMENGLEKSYEFKTSPFKIGRDPKQCDLIISEDKFMGRCHGVITFEDSQLYFEDLQSRNGSFTNGKRIEGKIKIQDEMIIKLAHTEFKIKK